MSEKLQELINRKPKRWGNLTKKEFCKDIAYLQSVVEEQQKKNKDMHRYATNIGRENALLLEEVERLSAMDGIAIQLEKAQQEIERLKNYCWKLANFINQVELEKENYRLQSAIKQCKETLEKIAFDADVQFFDKWIDLAKEQIERLNEVEKKWKQQ